ncbi:uncharacterized protein [Arachis hypogaea]|uniref:uncharacterized protein isoform X6 n=1 Tax=Arachis hypogaea TaxID=3818 RepID=UPI003B21668E
MYLKKEVINQFRKILREGKLYSISRFTVVPNIGAAKVVKHRYKLLFQFDTEVIPISDVEFPEASYSLETVESVVQMGQDSVYLIDVIGFLISVHDYSDVELDDGKKFKLVLIQLYSNGSYLTCNLFGDFLTKMRLALMNAVSQLPIILLQSVKVKIYEEKVVVQNVIDCSKIMINPDIPEAVCFITRYKVLVNVEDATGSARFVLYDRSAALLFKKKLIEVLRNFDAEHSRLLPPTIFSPIYEDVIQNLQHHDEISSLGSRISVNSDNMKSIEVDMEALGAAYNLTKPNEEFHLDASDFLYKLIGKKLVFMFDPQPVESDTICPAYNVFKVSTHEFMLKLIERVKNRVLNACAIVSASNVASIQDPISHISGSVLPAHKSVRVVNEIICNKRLASLYRDVPRSTKQKLEDAFSRSIDRTWNDNEEASSSMNI